MAAKPSKTKETSNETDGKPREVTREEGRKLFDRAARRYLKMGGDDFIRKWEAGEFAPILDDPKYHSKIISMVMLLPLVKEIPADAWRHSG